MSLSSRLWFRPGPVESADPVGTAPSIDAGQRIRVLSWNIQFGAGRRCLFFYDGGRDSRVTRAEVEHTLDGITALIRRENPDVVLLQEVDRNSARTHHIDQHQQLVRRLGYPTHVTTPYFKVPFVPVPAHAPMGKVDMHLSVLSRYALGPGRRFALSPLDEPRWRRAFNLRRALLQVSLQRLGGPDLQLFLTHLSAFSRGDGTLARQVDTLVERTAASAGPCLLAGDLNSLPPGDSPGRLGGADVLYSESATPIQPLFDALSAVSPPRERLLDPAFRSYVPYGSNRADRTIDYLFGRGLIADRVRTVPAGAEWSDHLPIVADLFLDASNASTSPAVTAVPC